MDISLILHKIRPNAAWSLQDNKYETLDWKDKSKKPTYDEVLQAWESVQEEIEKENVESMRRAAYQEEADPLFFEYQRGDSSKQEWLNKIAEIKAKYPYSGNSQT